MFAGSEFFLRVGTGHNNTTLSGNSSYIVVSFTENFTDIKTEKATKWLYIQFRKPTVSTIFVASKTNQMRQERGDRSADGLSPFGDESDIIFYFYKSQAFSSNALVVSRSQFLHCHNRLSILFASDSS